MAKVGRPTEYGPKILKRLKKYSEASKDTGNLPSIADLSLYLGVSRSTVYEWAKQYQEFSDILDSILAIQEIELMRRGLSGEWNPTITKLMLTKHGYTDKQDLTTGGKELPTPILNAVFSNDSNKEDSGA